MPVRIMVNGLGHVGRALLSAWGRVHPAGRLVAVADSCRAWLDDAGLDPATVLAEKRAGLGPARTVAGPDLIRQVRPDVLVEVTVTDLATGEPAIPDIEAALEAGAHVVTSSKSHRRSVALARRIESMASASAFIDHASVMGGLPVTEMADGCGMEVVEIEGILNGTTNYLLGRMEEGAEFAGALTEAQGRGMAEANWRYDVEGHDAALKLVGLARRFFHVDLEREDVRLSGLLPGRLGIDGVDRQVVADHLARGLRIKLIGRIARGPGGSVSAEVAPRVVDPADRWFRVAGTRNAVAISGRMNETPMEFFLIGPGAGADQTASRLLGNLNHLLAEQRYFHRRGTSAAKALSWRRP